ncbi:MAG TPA: rhamnulokinase family protein [Acidobacteriota bacterium]|nr:rhamnulokinase family protein [Acidobacteriota bacterium]
MNYLAFDLGAESGRAILGQLHQGILNVREIYRFANDPVRYGNELHWDILRLWHEMTRALESSSLPGIESIGVDTWGVDYALLGERGNLLENPFHYRDTRTEGMMEAVFAQIPRENIYDITGIQFLPFNTLYQLYAACLSTPRLIHAADALVTIPDLLNYWLSGTLASEYTNATTTQLVDAGSGSWATGLLAELDLPSRLLKRIVKPGTVIGELRSSISHAHGGTPVVAPACHDTGSAVAAVSLSNRSAFLSSGTWSLLGAEISAPVITPKARDLNFTNEGGVCGTIRLLKNIGGLWLLQSCRRCWAASGRDFTYEELMDAAALERRRFESLFDPDHRDFLNPADMPSAIAGYCSRTGQQAPSAPPAFTRAILESLALKYRHVLDSLEELTGIHFDEVRIMGGGSKNRLLNQFTADATGRTVVAGPTEATALGNIAMQMLATGAVTSLAEARQVIDRSFPAERFEPSEADAWESEYRRFQDYVASSEDV